MLEYVYGAYTVLVHSYSDVISALLGLAGAIALAKAPIESVKARRAIFEILTLDDTVGRIALASARDALVRDVERLLTKEEFWNWTGAGLLATSFLLLLVHAIDVLYFRQL